MNCPVTTDPARAAEVIRRGGLVALPTETVYGLGADATNPVAAAGIFAAKQRPFFDPLIVHLPSAAEVGRVASSVPELARRLAKKFWPGPLTLILPKQPVIPDIVTSGLETVGVRVPDHPLMQRVLELAGCPIAAPSANPFGRLSPTRAEHVLSLMGADIDLILDGGTCSVGVESTIIRVDGDVATILRPGGLSLEAISTVAGQVRIAAEESPTHPEAPGMLPQHYAPATPVVCYSGVPPLPSPGARWGLLSLKPVHQPGYAEARFLSESGNLLEAAARFFEALHELDRENLDQIVAESFPDEGLGRALNDRLKRAAATNRVARA